MVLASALQQYSSDHGDFPFRTELDPLKTGFEKYFGFAGWLQEALVPKYISEIPVDPQANTIIKIHRWFIFPLGAWDSFGKKWRGENWAGWLAIKRGEYLYQKVSIGEVGKIWTPYPQCEGGWAVLLAKVETPGAANYIANPKTASDLWWYWLYARDDDQDGVYHCPRQRMEWLHTCESFEKVAAGHEEYPTKNNKKCKYSHSDQLYYLHKITP